MSVVCTGSAQQAAIAATTVTATASAAAAAAKASVLALSVTLQMGRCPDLSAPLAGLYNKPLLGPKPNQLLVFKRPQLAVKLECLMQAADTAAAKHSNHSLVNQAIAAMYKHPQLHEHVAGWAPVRSGQLNAEVHLSFKDTSAQHRQQLASGGSIQVTMAGAAAPVSLPVSTAAAKQLPE